eukprot:scaffold12352_cov24-Prasinocladus_malaysianus.AAC.1
MPTDASLMLTSTVGSSGVGAAFSRVWPGGPTKTWGGSGESTTWVQAMRATTSAVSSSATLSSITRSALPAMVVSKCTSRSASLKSASVAVASVSWITWTMYDYNYQQSTGDYYIITRARVVRVLGNVLHLGHVHQLHRAILIVVLRVVGEVKARDGGDGQHAKLGVEAR